MKTKEIIMYKNMSATILLQQRTYSVETKRKTLILVKRLIEFTSFFHAMAQNHRDAFN